MRLKKLVLGLLALTIGIGPFIGIEPPVFATSGQSDESSTENQMTALEEALSAYEKKLKQSHDENARQQILEKVRQMSQSLLADGWSEKVVAEAFIKKALVSQTQDKIIKSLERYHSQAKLVGSEVYLSLWYEQTDSLSKKEARHLLEKLVDQLAVPEEYDGQANQIKDGLSAFSPDLEPSSDFWDSLARTVQKAYPGNSLAGKGVLARKVHQLRYLISAQQAQWVRDNYPNEKDDAHALAAYLSTRDEKDSPGEILGWEDSDYDMTYDFNESSRLHNKIAVSNSQFGVSLVVYPDYTMSSNIKIVMGFHSEFILDSEGRFLNELEIKGASMNALVNGASFNYANGNNKRHRQLDVSPVKIHDPAFRQKLQQAGYRFVAPNGIRYQWQETNSQSWENSYFNPDGTYSRKNKCSYALIKARGKAFKQLIEEYRQ